MTKSWVSLCLRGRRRNIVGHVVALGLKARDVRLDFLGHFDQRRGGVAVGDRLGETSALSGPRAHPVDDKTVFFGHKHLNSHGLSPFLNSAQIRHFRDACGATAIGQSVPVRDSRDARIALNQPRVTASPHRLADPFASRLRLGSRARFPE